MIPPASLRGALTAAGLRGLDWDRARPVSGGSIATARAVPGPGGPLFVKWLEGAPPGFFEAEAEGLSRLAVALPTPEVRAVVPGALALTFHAPAAPTRATWEEAGRALARLHARAGPAFGGVPDNFMGRLPQPNGGGEPFRGFADFFRRCRLDPLAEALPAPLRRRLDALDLEALLPDDAPPTLVHGDLWSGNLLMSEGVDGPVGLFIDPAIAYSHPLVDIAMARLFGGFATPFEGAYFEAHPELRRDLDDRVAILQLYPLLVHVHLFGASWLSDFQTIVDRYAPR